MRLSPFNFKKDRQMKKVKSYLKNKTIQESAVFFIMGISLFFYGMVNHYSVEISWGMSPYLFPVLISAFLICLSIALFAEGIKKPSKENDKLKRSLPMKRVLAVIALSLIYYAAIPFAGFVLSSVVFLAVLLVFLGEKRWYAVLSLSVITSFAVYFLFGKILGVMLP